MEWFECKKICDTWPNVSQSDWIIDVLMAHILNFYFILEISALNVK